MNTAIYANLHPDQQKEVDTINQMSRFSMAELWRFAPAGHPYFDRNLPYYQFFDARFEKLGRFSPEISKSLG